MVNKSLKESYFEKGGRNTTWSGIPLKTSYGPGDIEEISYEEAVGNPGEYPYKRGIYEDMYRGRLWSRREITGCSTPKLTNERFKMLLKEGETAINIICDQPTQTGLDSDHPWAEGSVGRAGVPICSIDDMWAIMDGLPLNEVSTMFSLSTPVAFPSYLLLADKLGIPYSELRVTSFAHPPASSAPVCLYGPRTDRAQELLRQERGHKEFLDKLEFAAKYLPKSYPTNFNGYNIRETGVGAAEEVAWVFANAFDAFQRLTERGVDIDLVAPKVSFTFSVMIDIFEEVAKFRAARRIWARTLKDKFGAKNPRSMRMKYHTNTAGVMMERQQAIINIVRAAYGGLAAILGGTQSLQIASYDEAIAIPTDKAATIALRTQQILAYETGVAGVADPLGGSYYVESLTSKLEEEIQSIIDTIEAKGGMSAAVASGYIDQEMEKAWIKRQREVEDKERIIVGVNEFVVPEEEDEEVVAYHQEVDQELVERHVDSVREMKKTRDQARTQRALEDLRRAIESEEGNLIEREKECCLAYCTTAEISGVKRMAVGLPYDPIGVLEFPFK